MLANFDLQTCLTLHKLAEKLRDEDDVLRMLATAEIVALAMEYANEYGKADKIVMLAHEIASLIRENGGLLKNGFPETVVVNGAIDRTTTNTVH